MSFSADLSGFAIKATGAVERTRRAIVLELFSSVIKDTPVLSGRLRGNWQTSIGAPKVAELPLRGGTTPNVVPAELQSEMDVAISQLKQTDQPIFLRNNLPYAGRIEFDGWSHTKAPDGMVRKNVARIQRIVAARIAEGKL